MTRKKAVLAMLRVLPTVKTVKYLKDEGQEQIMVVNPR